MPQGLPANPGLVEQLPVATGEFAIRKLVEHQPLASQPTLFTAGSTAQGSPRCVGSAGIHRESIDRPTEMKAQLLGEAGSGAPTQLGSRENIGEAVSEQKNVGPGIGFTMAQFISALAFPDPLMLPVAKLAVLIGSAIAAIAGLLVGRWALARDTGANLQPTEGVDA